MAGPPPKDPTQRRRRNATPGFEQLDPDGRTAPAPGWPFPPASEAEIAKWGELWSLPQAVKWEEQHAEDIVALYVRALIAVTQDLDAKLMNEVRQLDNKLGISPLAMRNMRWEVAAKKIEEPSPASNGKAARRYVPS